MDKKQSVSNHSHFASITYVYKNIVTAQMYVGNISYTTKINYGSISQSI